MKNKTKLKVATMVLAGGLAVTGCDQYKESVNTYDKQLNKEISAMTETQLQDDIQECDIALGRLQQTIDAEKTNPEERFEARRAYKSISQKRELLQKRLDKIKAAQNTTVRFNDNTQGR